MGTQLPLPWAEARIFGHVCCSQTAEWIKMPLGTLGRLTDVVVVGTEVDLGPGQVVLDGAHSFPRKRAQQPRPFGPCLLWPNGRPSQLLLITCSSISY